MIITENCHTKIGIFFVNLPVILIIKSNKFLKAHKALEIILLEVYEYRRRKINTHQHS